MCAQVWGGSRADLGWVPVLPSLLLPSPALPHPPSLAATFWILLGADIGIQCYIDYITAEPPATTDSSSSSASTSAPSATSKSSGGGSGSGGGGDGSGVASAVKGRDRPSSSHLRRLRYSLGILAIVVMLFIALFQVGEDGACQCHSSADGRVVALWWWWGVTGVGRCFGVGWLSGVGGVGWC